MVSDSSDTGYQLHVYGLNDLRKSFFCALLVASRNCDSWHYFHSRGYFSMLVILRIHLLPKIVKTLHLYFPLSRSLLSLQLIYKSLFPHWCFSFWPSSAVTAAYTSLQDVYYLKIFATYALDFTVYFICRPRQFGQNM